ncbi:MAG: helicase [Sphingomonadales bacterium]|nr:helicase [Sphingomonadales bacterium]MDE2170016.1 helicase [Sphingomonadales bacterium]
MAKHPPAPFGGLSALSAFKVDRPADHGRVKAVLGPTNTGKTHLAIERMCAHSSGMMGFPLRLLAREVYEKVVAIKGREHVALITGEERIEPKHARWMLCTVEAMPVSADVAFVGLDEIQLCADRERGHIFTDRLLHARGREETMLLGSATMEPMVKALIPGVEIVTRPRFSTLSYAGAKKLSRIPPRSAIVAFSAEQVYAVAEMLRRFRGGAAVVMGGLSPETRNRQVALYQTGEVDYLVATDAIGMGLNLDITYVAFAGLSKYDGVRQRRLTISEMAQIAGRAGRHQRDGTFGTLSGGAHQAEFTDEEIYAIEEHRFPPVTRLYWRESEPRFDSLATLIDDLETPPERAELMAAPEAIDLAVLKRLAEQSEITATLKTPAMLRRFWDVCRLPDFRQQGADTHARFVERLWSELAHGPLASDHAPRAIAQLDNTGGDIDTLQGRISAIRSWSYICQRRDWVLAQEDMAERARAVEARLSDALHARLTERFVNRRTAVLMRKLGPDSGLLPVVLEGDTVLVDGEPLGTLHGFRFRVDPTARLADRKLLLSAAERHLPSLMAARARDLAERLTAGPDAKTDAGPDRDLDFKGASIIWHGEEVARLAHGRRLLSPALTPAPGLSLIDSGALMAALQGWLERRLRPLASLARLEEASLDKATGSALRALLIRLVEAGGMIERLDSGLDRLDKEQRDLLRRLGVKVGAIDLFLPAMLKASAQTAWAALHGQPGMAAMPAILPAERKNVPMGYRRLGGQALRLDKAEALLREAHGRRAAARGRAFALDPHEAVKMGLTTRSYAHLLRLAGFRAIMPRVLADDVAGPPAPLVWRWHPPRREHGEIATPLPTGAFAALAQLVA